MEEKGGNMEGRSIGPQISLWKSRETVKITPEPWAHLAQLSRMREGFKRGSYDYTSRGLASSDLV